MTRTCVCFENVIEHFKCTVSLVTTDYQKVVLCETLIFIINRTSEPEKFVDSCWSDYPIKWLISEKPTKYFYVSFKRFIIRVLFRPTCLFYPRGSSLDFSRFTPCEICEKWCEICEIWEICEICEILRNHRNAWKSYYKTKFYTINIYFIIAFEDKN